MTQKGRARVHVALARRLGQNGHPGIGRCRVSRPKASKGRPHRPQAPSRPGSPASSRARASERGCGTHPEMQPEPMTTDARICIIISWYCRTKGRRMTREAEDQEYGREPSTKKAPRSPFAARVAGWAWGVRPFAHHVAHLPDPAHIGQIGRHDGQHARAENGQHPPPQGLQHGRQQRCVEKFNSEHGLSFEFVPIMAHRGHVACDHSSTTAVSWACADLAHASMVCDIGVKNIERRFSGAGTEWRHLDDTIWIAEGFLCPLPVLRAAKLLRQMAPAYGVRLVRRLAKAVRRCPISARSPGMS